MGRKTLVAAAVLAGAFGLFAGLGIGNHYGYQRAERLCTLADGIHVKVRRVIDGDTIVLDDNGNDGEHIRLLGINAPEMRKAGRKGTEPYAVEAKNYLEEMIKENGNKVVLERDFMNARTLYRDDRGRPLRHLFIGEENISIRLLREGYAVSFMSKGLKDEAEILKTEEEAKNAKRKVWAQSNQ